MARRLTFEQFKQRVAAPSPKVRVLAKYVEFDPTSPVPKLRFRPYALTDGAPDTFDVDALLRERMHEVRRQKADAKIVDASATRVLAEGDSWFNLPWLVKPKTICDYLDGRRAFDVTNIGSWGHTLEEMIEAKEHLHYLVVRPSASDVMTEV